MGDISREPLPGGARSKGPTGKGPAEVIRLDELTADELMAGELPVGERMETSDPRQKDEQADDPAERAFPSPRFAPAAPLRVEPFAIPESREQALREAAAAPELPVTQEEVVAPVLEPDGDPVAPIAVPEVEDLVSEDAPEDRGSTAEPMLQGLADTESDDAPPLTEAGEVARVLLAVLLCTREPLSFVRLAEVCNSTQKAVQAGIEALDRELRERGLPLEVLHVGDGIRVSTSPAVYPYLTRLKKLKGPEKLSPAALETLAVIAYRQPAIRAEIEAIRGVKVGPMLRSLLDHKLVKVVGRAEVPGRPLQYGTTQVFLERFALRSLKDLPSVQEFRSLG